MRIERGISIICRTVALAAMSLSIHPIVRAETIFGLTSSNGLISFDSATPGTASTIGAITGLTAGDMLVGIDIRPQVGPNNGLLYSLGVNLADGSARIYTLSQTDASATLVSTLAADPADVTPPFPFTTVAGSAFGIDFNPVVDRMRVVSDTGQNLRINVDTGLVQMDVPLAYMALDPNFGDSPVDTGIAYSNNFGGATTTVLRGVDLGQDPDLLVVHANPNGGTLSTALSLPFNSGPNFGYDVSGLSGTPYFSVTPIGSASSSLYAAGPGGVSLVGTIGGGSALVDIAAPVGTPIPEPGTAMIGVTGLAVLVAVRRRGPAIRRTR